MLIPTQVEVQGMVDMEDGLLVYSTSQSTVISLNSSARRIWQLCDGSRTAEDICRELADSLGVEPPDLAPDIESGLEQLEKAGLIAWNPPGASKQQ